MLSEVNLKTLSLDRGDRYKVELALVQNLLTLLMTKPFHLHYLCCRHDPFDRCSDQKTFTQPGHPTDGICKRLIHIFALLLHD